MFFAGLLLLCCGYALLRGGAPEQVGALLLVLAFVLTIPVHRLLDTIGYRFAGAGTAVIDAALLAALIVLAWRSTRFWPLWMAGWQLATVITHAAKAVDPAMLAAGYAVEGQAWSYLIVLAIAGGTWRHQRRASAGVEDGGWKFS